MHLKCFIGKHIWKIYKVPMFDYQAKVCQKCACFKIFETIDNIDFIIATDKDEFSLGLNLLLLIMKIKREEENKETPNIEK